MPLPVFAEGPPALSVAAAALHPTPAGPAAEGTPPARTGAAGGPEGS